MLEKILLSIGLVFLVVVLIYCFNVCIRVKSIVRKENDHFRKNVMGIINTSFEMVLEKQNRSDKSVKSAINLVNRSLAGSTDGIVQIYSEIALLKKLYEEMNRPCEEVAEEPKPWKPEAGEVFYFLDNTMDVTRIFMHPNQYYQEMWQSNNCFKTAELAHQAAVEVKKVLANARKR